MAPIRPLNILLLILGTKSFKSPSPHVQNFKRFALIRPALSKKFAPQPQVIIHEGICCDACGMDPITGIRLECTNVKDVDICGVCGSTAGQTFTAGGKASFSDLTWRIISKPGALPQSSPEKITIREVSEVDFEEIDFEEVDLAAMVKDLNGKADLLDVREKEEFEAGHFTIAAHSPLSTLRQGIHPEGPDTGVPYELNQHFYVHCAKGGRATQAARLLQKMGYTAVPLTGTGFEELAASGIFEELVPQGSKLVATGPAYEFYDNTVG